MVVGQHASDDLERAVDQSAEELYERYPKYRNMTLYNEIKVVRETAPIDWEWTSWEALAHEANRVSK